MNVNFLFSYLPQPLQNGGEKEPAEVLSFNFEPFFL